MSAITLFRNDDIDEQKLIKRKRFINTENAAELIKFVGNDLDLEAEFGDLDKNKDDKVIFEDLVKWALKKNMLIELANQEEKEKIADNEEENNE